ncbi:MAG TPA: hypothetical protein VFZ78_06000 [Flavisolibacter sp.]
MAYSEGEKDFFKKRHTTTFAFAVAVLLFLLPFVEFRCNGFVLADARGIDLVGGTVREKLSKNEGTYSKFKREEWHGEKKAPFTKPNPFAIIALAAGFGGLLLSFFRMRTRPLLSIVAGAIGALSLLALLISVKNRFDMSYDDEGGNVELTADFTVPYYFSFFAFIVAAFFGWKHRQLQAHQDMPPDRAPQVRIQNPGEQSDFPSAATDSEIG